MNSGVLASLFGQKCGSTLWVSHTLSLWKLFTSEISICLSWTVRIYECSGYKTLYIAALHIKYINI